MGPVAGFFDKVASIYANETSAYPLLILGLPQSTTPGSDSSEYDMMKAAFDSLPDGSSSDQMLTAGTDNGSALVPEESYSHRMDGANTDNGSEFVNKELAKSLRANGVVQRCCRPYNPQAQGKVERQQRTCANFVKARSDNFTRPWCHLLAVRIPHLPLTRVYHG